MITDLPPTPPGMRAPAHSPKQQEFLQSLGTPMVKIAVSKASVVPQGFIITNIVVNDTSILLQWQSGLDSVVVEGAISPTGPWQDVGSFKGTIAAFDGGLNHFWRLRGNVTPTPGSFVNALAATSDLYANVKKVAVASDNRIAFAGNMFNFVNWGNGQINSAGGSDSMIGVGGVTAPLWTKAIGSNNDGEAAQSVVFDSIGNMVVFGHFLAPSGEDFGGQLLSSISTSPNRNLYLVKHNAAVPPAIVSLVRYGSVSGANASDMTIDANDNIYLVASLNSDTAFGSFTLHAGGALVKLDPTGHVVYATQVGISGDHSIACITADTDGSVAIGGIAFGSANNAYIRKYNSDGNLVFERVFTSSSPASAIAAGVAIGGDHRIYVTGLVGAGSDFGGTITDFFDNVNTNGGSFLACYESGGAYQWAKTPNVVDYTATTDQGFGVVVDDNNVYFCGKAGGGIYLGNTNNLILLGGQGSFLASVHLDSSPNWGFRSGGATGFGECLALMSNNQLVIGGQVSNNVMYFDNANHTNGLVATTSGRTAPFIAVFNR